MRARIQVSDWSVWLAVCVITGAISVHWQQVLLSLTLTYLLFMQMWASLSGLSPLISVLGFYVWWFIGLLLHRSSGAFPLALSSIRILYFQVPHFIRNGINSILSSFSAGNWLSPKPSISHSYSRKINVISIKFH